ncbi:hypothetical protein EUGRSUZ_J02490 [Eucalyptus grandis]|uniref:Uncharacterized protein n=2 Tax=Eucalyptus grandis TaxID=71139 RepID=A0ACC3J8T1_EUCGR|nr:hypothetical protein EUGRSUZ_J02490 [Eucalyptus grandis]
MVRKVKIEQLFNQIRQEFARNRQILKCGRLEFGEGGETKATSFDSHLSGHIGKGLRCFCFHQIFFCQTI